MRAAALLVGLALCLPAWAAETQVLPRGTWVLDVSFIQSSLDSQWSNASTRESLLPSIERYEPGGGLQGVLTARPEVSFRILNLQLGYGLTDDVALALVVPVVLGTRVTTHLGWEEGDYQPQLGRPYSEADFWSWAQSMGQPRPPDEWTGNQGVLADVVLGARYRLKGIEWLEKAGLTAAVGVQVALPTGRPPDREEIVAVGTTSWDLHSFGDVEAHAALSRSLWTDQAGVDRIRLTADVFYSFFRPRTYEAARGEKNPLLMTYAPYVGDTYVLDPGDWLSGTATVEAAVFAGPTARGLIFDAPPPRDGSLPPLVSLFVAYTRIQTAQSDWQSDSPLWDWEREQYWRPGFKNIFRAGVTVSLVRVGLPLQLYAQTRTQLLLPGRNIRPAEVLTGGMRLLARF